MNMQRNSLEPQATGQPQPTEPKTDTPKKAAKKAHFFTDPDYTVREGEENDVHVLIAREFHKGMVNNRTQIEVKESVQIVDPKMWLLCREQWPKQGWIFVKMLHVPTEMPVGFADTVTATAE